MNDQNDHFPVNHPGGVAGGSLPTGYTAADSGGVDLEGERAARPLGVPMLEWCAAFHENGELWAPEFPWQGGARRIVIPGQGSTRDCVKGRARGPTGAPEMTTKPTRRIIASVT